MILTLKIAKCLWPLHPSKIIHLFVEENIVLWDMNPWPSAALNKHVFCRIWLALFCDIYISPKRKIFPVWEAYSCLEIYYNKGGGYFFPVCLQVVALEVLVIRFECSLMCFPSHVVKENLLHLFTLIWVCSGKLVETAESSRKWNANKQILAELCYC